MATPPQFLKILISGIAKSTLPPAKQVVFYVSIKASQRLLDGMSWFASLNF